MSGETNGVKSQQGNTRTVHVMPGIDVFPDEVLPLMPTTPNRPFTYCVGGKKTYVAYAPSAIDALELFEAASLGLVLDIANVREETEESMREWERACCASMTDGRSVTG